MPQMMNPAMATGGRPHNRQYQGQRQSNRAGPRQNQRQAQPQPQVAKSWNLDYLKEHLQEFMDYSQEKKVRA